MATQDLHVHSHTHRSQYTLFTARAQAVPCACAACRFPPSPRLWSSVCVCKLVQCCVSQPLRAQTSGWVCAL